jgi:hypothetical protein
MFCDYLSVPSSRVKLSKKNNNFMPHNKPEHGRIHFNCSGSLLSHKDIRQQVKLVDYTSRLACHN